MREKHCYLAGAGINDVRKKYCKAGAAAEQPNTVIDKLPTQYYNSQRKWRSYVAIARNSFVEQ